MRGMNTAPTTPEDQRLDAMWGQRCATLSRAWVQVRYHRRRQRFFDLVDKFTKALTVVLGASLMGQYFLSYLPELATLLTSLGFLALVFGYGDKKQLHKELAEQAAQLVAEIELVPVAGLSFDLTSAWAAAYARLIAKAPPALKALTLICEHEQATVDGHPAHVRRPIWLRRLMADFVA
jgi:hypothetical protein